MRVSGHRLLTLAFCIALPFSANAAGLGELRVASALGERFRAEIPVVNATESMSQGCFHLATTAPEAIADAPWLDNAHVAFEANPPRLLISTRRPVFDPVVQLAIYTGCGTYLTRHFVALLSPPKDPVAGSPALSREIRPAVATPPVQPAAGEGMPRRKVVSSARTALPGETASDMARRLHPRSKAAQKRFVDQMVALNPEWLSSSAGDELLPEGVDLKYPQPPQRKKAERKVAPASATAAEPATKSSATDTADKSDRLVLSPGEPLLPGPAAELSPARVDAEISARISGVEQQIITARAQIKSLRDQYPSPPPAVQTLLADLEARLITVELNVARINLANLAGEKQPEPMPPPVAPVSVAATSSMDAQTNPVESEKAVEPPFVAPPAPTAVPVADAADGFDVGVLLLGVLGFGVGLGTLLYRRARGRGVPLNSQEDRETQGGQPQIQVVDTVFGGGAGNQRMPKPQMVSPKPALSEVPVGEPADSTPRPVVDDPEEIERPVEMADIMLAYGQTQSAIDVLKGFIDAHPARSFKTAMRLLELYKQANMRMEFEEFATQLSRQHGISPMRWHDMRSGEAGKN